MSSTIPAELKNQKYILLTTFRKNGVPVRTPVWFAEQDGKLYVFTNPTSGKVKRTRNNPEVRVAPSTIRGKVTGPEFAAKATILPPRSEERRVGKECRSRGWPESKKKKMKVTHKCKT